MTTDLLLTLGHGSSAIAMDDGYIVCGYEEERLTGEKSTSKFPRNAIDRCGFKSYDTIYVSHWDPLGKVSQMADKYWCPEELPPHECLVSLSADFTHHDCHAFSALAFSGIHAHTMVVDGFGNFGETMSIYGHDMQLIYRSRGYLTSIGLMYQYATTYLGFKPNQDEFKLLGYESQLASSERRKCQPHIQQITEDIITRMDMVRMTNIDDPLFDLAALVKTQKYWHDEFSRYKKGKAHVAYVAQSVTQRVILHFIQRFNITNVRLVGGVFMNVKLTMLVEKAISGTAVTMPLSGDQGAALGLYKYHHPGWHMPNTVKWGQRVLPRMTGLRVHSCTSSKEVTGLMMELLADNNIVNLVCGPMEFGPRALCNTSTIAQPSLDNVRYINKVNGRDTIMPMGPVVSRNAYDTMFKSALNDNSCYYMATAVEYKDGLKEEYKGVSHVWWEGKSFTGRPQIMGEVNHPMWHVVNHYGVLINTSFNIHGQPIVFEEDSIRKAIEYQRTHDTEKRIHTIILESV